MPHVTRPFMVRLLQILTGVLPAGRAPALAILGLLLLAGCRGDFDGGDESLRLDLGISPTPPAVGATRLIITLHDTAGVPIEGAEILVEGNMRHAGTAPVIDTAQAEAPGRYAIPGFRFTTAGDWVLTIHATLPDGRWARDRMATDVVGVPGGLR